MPLLAYTITRGGEVVKITSAGVDVLRFGHPISGQRKCHPMKETVTLNRKEQKTLLVLNLMISGQITGRKAAELLNRSVRQVRRTLAAYRQEGAAALAHGN